MIIALLMRIMHCECLASVLAKRKPIRVWLELQANYYTVVHFMYVEYCKPLITSLPYGR